MLDLFGHLFFVTIHTISNTFLLYRCRSRTHCSGMTTLYLRAVTIADVLIWFVKNICLPKLVESGVTVVLHTHGEKLFF